MQTIVLRSRGPEADPLLVDVLRRLFPECEIQLIPADNPADDWWPGSSAMDSPSNPSRSSRFS